jgi:hypothetical protein
MSQKSLNQHVATAQSQRSPVRQRRLAESLDTLNPKQSSTNREREKKENYRNNKQISKKCGSSTYY